MVNKKQREKWLRDRRKYLGASDAAAALGLSPYRTPLDVCRDKWGEAGDIEPNKYMIRGQLMEPILRRHFSEMTGQEVTDEYHVVSPDHYWMSATPDGKVVGSDPATSLQIKTASSRGRDKWGEAGTAEIPDDYMIQVQHEMAVTGDAVTIVYVMFADESFYDPLVALLKSRIRQRGRLVLQIASEASQDATSSTNIESFTVHRDDDMIGALIEQERHFWETYVIPHVEPPDASRPETEKRLLTAEGDTVEIIERLKEAYINRQCAEEVYEELSRKLQGIIGEYEGIYYEPYGAIKWKAPKPGSKTDWEALARAAVPADQFGTLVAQHTTQTQGKRRFTVPRW